MSPSTDWPPRRLPSRVRLFRIQLLQLRGDILLPAVQRLALWTGWFALTGSAFMMIDLYL